jgi:hypothetical protein
MWLFSIPGLGRFNNGWLRQLVFVEIFNVFSFCVGLLVLEGHEMLSVRLATQKTLPVDILDCHDHVG